MPIVVAVLGIIGVIGGQLVNAWREDRRWRRELHREDQRWERERARDREQHVHNARIEWRLQRFEAYQQFLAAVDAFKFPGWYVKLLHEKTATQSDHAAEGVRQAQHWDDMRKASVAVEFVAGKSVQKPAHLLKLRATMMRHLIAPTPAMKTMLGELTDNEKSDKLQEHFIEYVKMRDTFVHEVKLELAIETGELVSEGSTPSQPSGQTS